MKWGGQKHEKLLNEYEALGTVERLNQLDSRPSPLRCLGLDRLARQSARRLARHRCPYLPA